MITYLSYHHLESRPTFRNQQFSIYQCEPFMSETNAFCVIDNKVTPINSKVGFNDKKKIIAVMPHKQFLYPLDLKSHLSALCVVGSIYGLKVQLCIYFPFK